MNLQLTTFMFIVCLCIPFTQSKSALSLESKAIQNKQNGMLYSDTWIARIKRATSKKKMNRKKCEKLGLVYVNGTCMTATDAANGGVLKGFGNFGLSGK